jgi:hypothetical protein
MDILDDSAEDSGVFLLSCSLSWFSVVVACPSLCFLSKRVFLQCPCVGPLCARVASRGTQTSKTEPNQTNPKTCPHRSHRSSQALNKPINQPNNSNAIHSPIVKKTSLVCVVVREHLCAASTPIHHEIFCAWLFEMCHHRICSARRERRGSGAEIIGQ